MLGLVAAALLTVGGYGSLYTDVPPPIRFQGNSSAVVFMVSPSQIDDLCGLAPPGKQTEACEHTERGQSAIIVPNACLFPNDPYAQTMCHEFAHRNGWPADHPR